MDQESTLSAILLSMEFYRLDWICCPQNLSAFWDVGVVILYGLVLSLEDLPLREFTFSAISQSRRTILSISLTHSNSQDWCSGLNHLQDSKVEFTWGEIYKYKMTDANADVHAKFGAKAALHEKIKN